jgi:hypothetical protein
VSSALTEPESSEGAAPPVVPRLRRWLAPLFFLAGIGLLPWTAYLTVTLPGRHLQTGYYDLAWGGFDVGLAALLVATGVGLLRRKLWVQSTATAVATMLVCDAWFDVVTSTGAGERLEAVLEAVFGELPLAAVCGLIVFDAERFRRATYVRYRASYRRIRGR